MCYEGKEMNNDLECKCAFKIFFKKKRKFNSNFLCIDFHCQSQQISGHLRAIMDADFEYVNFVINVKGWGLQYLYCVYFEVMIVMLKKSII